ncbi:MAG: ROK family protein [Planctomycetota bacterium]
MNHANALGIDIGGTFIKGVLVDHDGKLLKEFHEPSTDDVEALVSVVLRMVDEAGLSRNAPLGIAAPGLASSDYRTIRWMQGRLSSVQDLDWGARLDRKARVLNDAHAATVGEAWIGAASGSKNVVLLTLGTGVGGGVVCDGRLLRGALGRAGHLGHITLDRDGPPDIVGTPGSLEDLVGDCTIRQRTPFESTVELVEAVRRGEEQAHAYWMDTVQALACGIVSFINVFDPNVVVIGGGISKAGSYLFEPLQQLLDQHEWRPTRESVAVVPASLGDLSGAVGAARFAMLGE